MKQIFDWMREQMHDRIKWFQTMDTTDVACDVAIKETERFIEYINEAEAKWEAEKPRAFDADAVYRKLWRESEGVCGNTMIEVERENEIILEELAGGVEYMAELIDKGAFLKEIESIKFLEDAKKMKVSDAEMDGFFKGMVEGTLYFVPTTTESEIRAKAIDEFAEKLIAHFTDWAYQEAPANDDETDRTRCIICDTIHDAMGAVDEIAEQLKGE